MTAAIAEPCRRAGLSHAALNALAVIEGAGGPITPGDLVTAMHITSGSITSLVDTLEKRGLVTRVPDPDDRRKVRIDITPEAQDLLDGVLHEIQLVARVALDPLTAAEQAELLRLLDKLNAEPVDHAAVPTPPSPRRRPAHLSRPR